MQDHTDLPARHDQNHGLRPETWAVAEYDALREALSVLMADVIDERRSREVAASAARSAGRSVEADGLSGHVSQLRDLEHTCLHVRSTTGPDQTEPLRKLLESVKRGLASLPDREGLTSSRVA